ncbi:MAG: NAD(P)H-binding protein [Pseudomonadota bacterium]
MSGTALILGASGRFGRHVTQRFRREGWTVRVLRRQGVARAGEVVADIFDEAQMIAAAEGVDVIVNALNPKYSDWPTDTPRFTRTIITAAEAHEATVLIAGNVYVYGPSMPPLLTPNTPHDASDGPGRIRVDMEAAYRASSARTILLRAGDFIDTQASGNWFESHIAKDVAKGRFAYPGPMDLPHAWAFLPDMARAAELLARRRETLPRFADIPFPGFTLTGAELQGAVEAAVGRSMRRRSIPWLLLRLMALTSVEMRGVMKMRYLWNTPHALDHRAFDAVLPGFAHTSVVDAIAQSIGSPNPAQSKVMSTQTSL